MTDDLHVLRSALAARLVDCWERIEDAIAELCAVHEVPEHEIVARVRELIATQADAVEAPGSAFS